MGREKRDRALQAPSDEDLAMLIERARERASSLSEDEIAVIVAEGIRAVRAWHRRRSSAVRPGPFQIASAASRA